MITANKKHLLALGVLIMIFVLLAGLRPKPWSMKNDAILVEEKGVLKFNGHGIAYINHLDSLVDTNNLEDFAIQITFVADNIDKTGFRPIMIIHSGDDFEQIAIWNWGPQLIAMNGDDYDHSRKLPRVYSKGVLVPEIISKLTINSNKFGTQIFYNGVIVAENNKWRLSIPSKGENFRIVLGNSVYGNHGWHGQIHQVAVYSRALSLAEIRAAQQNSPQYSGFQFRYFDDSGSKSSKETINIHEHFKSLPLEQALILPSFITPLKTSFFLQPWSSFSLNRSVLLDFVINLVGFMPLAMVIYVLVLHSNYCEKRLAMFVTISTCFLLSLGIEVIQAWVPGRDSSYIDVVFNTLGAATGLLLAETLFRLRIMSLPE